MSCKPGEDPPLSRELVIYNWDRQVEPAGLF